jgi:hypothetical protein
VCGVELVDGEDAKKQGAKEGRLGGFVYVHGGLSER